MTLHVIESTEPLTAAARAADEPPPLVESDEFRLLHDELARYCRQEVNGRSFLISGHRGSGKTTIVSHAFERVLREFESSIRDLTANERLLRPLLVTLHGPSLLPPLATKARTNDVPDRDGMSGEMRLILSQITLGLHRALAREMATAYRERMAENARESMPDHVRDLFELAAALEVEFYEPPTPARLRQFWDRGGVLDSGVFPRGRLGDSRRPPPGQGFRELVAAAGICEAYRRISGTFTQEERAEDKASAKLESTSAVHPVNKEMWSAVLSLLVGGTAALATAASGQHPALAAGIGLGSALGSAGVIKFSTTRARERSLSREFTFLADLSVATLDRTLPMLMDRLREAGLAPIFAIDELDKVENLSSRILGMVHHLKKLVAETAFFAFITDRWYYESIMNRSAGTGYPVEHTYFNHKLFIVFQPSDLHDFVNKSIPAPARPTQSGPALLEFIEDEADHPFVEWIVLHRSRMHTIDLRRQISYLHDETGKFRPRPGAVRTTRAYRFDVRVQVAIEMVLDGDELQLDLTTDPEFRRITYDALYYPSRRWEENADEPLDLTADEGLDSFRDYLLDRIGRDNEGIDPHAESSEGGRVSWRRTGRRRTDIELNVADEDVRFLFDRVKELVGLLSNHADFDLRLTNWNERRAQHLKIPQVIFGAMRTIDPPPLRKEDAKDVWKWVFHPSGRFRDEFKSLAAQAAPWEESARFIRACDDALADLVS